MCYTEWCSALTKAACDNFLKASKIGGFLGEPHLISNAAVYMWNYNRHSIQGAQLVPAFRALLATMRKLPKFKYVRY